MQTCASASALQSCAFFVLTVLDAFILFVFLIHFHELSPQVATFFACCFGIFSGMLLFLSYFMARMTEK